MAACVACVFNCMYCMGRRPTSSACQPRARAGCLPALPTACACKQRRRRACRRHTHSCRMVHDGALCNQLACNQLMSVMCDQQRDTQGVGVLTVKSPHWRLVTTLSVPPVLICLIAVATVSHQPHLGSQARVCVLPLVTRTLLRCLSCACLARCGRCSWRCSCCLGSWCAGDLCFASVHCGPWPHTHDCSWRRGWKRHHTRERLSHPRAAQPVRTVTEHGKR
jgi:hypothetical protein